MKQSIITIIAVFVFSCILQAQNTIQQPVDIGSKTFSFTYTDTKNTVNYTNDYPGRPANDVYYKFTLTQAMDVSIDHCGSELNDTYVHLLNSSGVEIDFNDDDLEYEFCDNIMNSYLYMSNLPAGTYYVVSEGYIQNGNITTTIQGIGCSEVGSSLLIPTEIGNNAFSFEYTDTKNTVNYVNNYPGRPTKDVFYKFSISTAMDVEISHCGSVLNDTYLNLLNEAGTRINYNDDYGGADHCSNTLNSYIKMNLSAGTYYVVSEGYGLNGIITTSIKGICPLPASGLYDGNAVTKPENKGRNYILAITPTVGTSDVSGLGVNESLQTIQYFDGLGRPIQTVQRGITTDKEDLATYTEYDGAGRENIQWLPITNSGNGVFVELSTFKQGSSLYNNDLRPFSETIYESSPLNRVLEQYGAGNEWKINNKKSQIFYQSNIASEVIDFRVVNNQLTKSGYYGANMLYKTESKDEDGKSVWEYKDKLGQIVMKQSKADVNTYVDTYYIYNDLGQLSYVIPPRAVDELGADLSDENIIMRQLCFLYKYDERGNCIQKRLPGCAWIYMVYDKATRLILSQDGNQRVQSPKKWTLNKYDNLGRLLYTTEITNDLSLLANLVDYLKNIVVTETFAIGSQSYPMEDTGYSWGLYRYLQSKLLTVNYYDDYSFLSKLKLPIKKSLTFDSGKLQEYGIQYTSAKGLLTGTRTYVLDGSGTYTTTVLYYDSNGQVVQSRSTNYLGGYDMEYNAYNFSGQMTKKLKVHNIADQSPIEELYTYYYDHSGRIKLIKYKLNNNIEVMLADMTPSGSYDKLGRLIKKKRHNGADYEEFDYNIRNWTTRILSGTYQEQLFYNTLPNGVNGFTSSYNGNIAYMVSGNTNSMPMRSYRYKYDDLNRLTDAYGYYFTSIESGACGYNENFVFDKQGNMKFLNRTKENTQIDFLTLNYKGNQLNYVNDNGTTQGLYNVKEYQNKSTATSAEFVYDENGNMTKDLDREIWSIKYNILNLPEIIQFMRGHQIVNKYDASGKKLKTEYYTDKQNLPIPLQEGQIRTIAYLPASFDYSSTAYVDNKEYICSKILVNSVYTDKYQLKCLHNQEGYVEDNTGTSGALFYYYYRKDHLGNNREVWRASSSINGYTIPAEIRQRTNYYPSGLPWGSTASDNLTTQPYKYNGKEFVEMHGLDTYDYGARGYYAASARFMTLDPLAEKYYSISPYAYCAGNPVNRIDIDGRKISNSSNYVLSNRTLMIQLAKFDKAVSNLSGLDRSSYTFLITGGDRYRKNGKIYSATNNTYIEKAVKFSTHLREMGACGIDMKFSKKISYETLKSAAKSIGMRLDPSGPYKDHHIHLDIKNYKGQFIYEDLNYIPTDNDYLGDEEPYIGDEKHPYKLPSIEVKAKNLNPEETLDERIDDMLWSTVRPNENGNTGRYNHDGRSTDQNYSDDFLKWYYNDGKKKSSERN